MVHLQLFSLLFQPTISGAIAVPMFLFDDLDRIFKGQSLFWEQTFKDLFGVLQGQHRGLDARRDRRAAHYRAPRRVRFGRDDHDLVPVPPYAGIDCAGRRAAGPRDLYLVRVWARAGRLSRQPGKFRQINPYGLRNFGLNRRYSPK